MAYTRTPKLVTVYGLGDVPGTFDPAKLLRLDLTHGARWGVAELFFPRAAAFAHDKAQGDECTIKLNDTQILLKGNVLDVRNGLMDGEDGSFLTVYDLRWDMARITIGQHGTGDWWSPGGGFAGVGLDIVFNPRGVGNRSAEADEESGLYAFSTLATAARWTLIEMLRWVLAWYYPGVTVPETVPASFEKEEPDVNLMLQPVPEAISIICQRAGYSWALTYGEAVTLSFVGETGGAAITLDLPAEGEEAKASDAGEFSVLDLDHQVSIRDAVDVVEVRSTRRLIETTYSTEDADPLLVALANPPPGYVAWYRVDVTKYEAHQLGKNLPDGSLPKRWVRYNNTRINDAGTDYLPKDDPGLVAGRGRPTRPEEGCWIIPEGGVSKERVLSGIEIHPDQALLMIAQNVTTTGAAYSYNDTARPVFKVWLTVTTEIEIPWVYVTPAPGPYHISADKPIRAVIQRTDMVPRLRYKARHFKLTFSAGTGDEEDTMITLSKAATAPELLQDVAQDLKLVHDAYYAARHQPEVTLSARLLDIPLIAIGARVQVSTAAPYLTGNELVLSVSYEFARGDYVRVLASNSMARALAGEL